MATSYDKQVLSLKDSLEYEKEAIVEKTVIKNKLTGYAFDRGQSVLPSIDSINMTLLVLEGRAEVMVAGKNYDVEEGQKIFLPKEHIHALFAKTKLKFALIND